MDTPNLMDFVLVTFASYFFVSYLHRKEMTAKAEDLSAREQHVRGRINMYFLLTTLVCAFALCAVELFVPYGSWIMLALAVCGLCSILMDCMLLILTVWIRKYKTVQQCDDKLRPQPTVKNESAEKKNQDPYQLFYGS